MHISTRQLTRGALLVALALVLALSGLGEVRVPTMGQAITWTHVPVIMAGILLGPFLGGIVGLIWGVNQWFHYTFPPNPLIHILPRVAVGVFSSWAFNLVSRWMGDRSSRLTVAAGVAAVVGTATNTFGVLSMAVITGFFTVEQAATVAVLHFPLELAAAVVITIPTTVALHQRLYQRE